MSEVMDYIKRYMDAYRKFDPDQPRGPGGQWVGDGGGGGSSGDNAGERDAANAKANDEIKAAGLKAAPPKVTPRSYHDEDLNRRVVVPGEYDVQAGYYGLSEDGDKTIRWSAERGFREGFNKKDADRIAAAGPQISKAVMENVQRLAREQRNRFDRFTQRSLGRADMAPRARLDVTPRDNGTIDIKEYDFEKWKATVKG